MAVKPHAHDDGVGFVGTEVALGWSYCSGNSFWFGGLQPCDVATVTAEAPPREVGCAERMSDAATPQCTQLLLPGEYPGAPSTQDNTPTLAAKVSTYNLRWGFEEHPGRSC